MRRKSHTGLSDKKDFVWTSVEPKKPFYFTSAAEPLIIETPIERKISRARAEQQQMAAIADVNHQNTTSTTQKSLTLGSTSSTEEHEYEQPQKGIWQSIRSYPKGVFFMLGNEFCERFSFYGMRAILIIYLTTDHQLSEQVAKQIYHSFVSLAYFSPLFGSILADNYFGRFHVILWVSLVYVFGHVLLSIGAIPYLEVAIKRGLDYTGLAIIAIATGGIKPCVSAFAADQFGDEQHRERTQFFSFFYFAINAGSLIAIALTPLLRKVKCFGSEHCFPLAFGVPGVLMLLAFLTFLAGWRFYKITPASKGNILGKVIKCICHALRIKIRKTLRKKKLHCQNDDTVNHWLDYALPNYDQHLVAGIKSMLAILVLYIPVVFFWALFDQQGSTWVLQARRMDGRVGWFTILPDQMNTFNPLMILILVPMFEAWIYPLMGRLCKVTPLRKMAIGGILAAVAFCMAGLVQIKINDTMEPRPTEGHTFIHLLGNHSTDFFAIGENNETLHKNIHIRAKSGNGKYELLTRNYTFTNNDNQTFKLNLSLAKEEKPRGFVVGLFITDGEIKSQSFPYAYEKTEDGKTRFYFFIFSNSSLVNTKAFAIDEDGKVVATANISNGAYIDIQPGFYSQSSNYNIIYGNCSNSSDERPICNYQHEIQVQMGAAFVLDLLTPLVRSNSVSILWQLPQVFVITVGEILFSVTGLEFSYSQAAPSMKSVLQALWLLTVFFGNLIDIIISSLEISDPVAEFFIYAALMFFVIGIFILLAVHYTYVDEHNLEIPDSPQQKHRIVEESDDEKESQFSRNLPRPHILGKDGNE